MTFLSEGLIAAGIPVGPDGDADVIQLPGGGQSLAGLVDPASEIGVTAIVDDVQSPCGAGRSAVCRNFSHRS